MRAADLAGLRPIAVPQPASLVQPCHTALTLLLLHRELLVELHNALPDKMLVAFRAKISARLRSEAGLQSLMKMVRLIPTVSVSSGSAASRQPSGKLSTRHTAPSSSSGMSAWGSILDSQGSFHGLLDSKGHDILDSAFSLVSPRPPLSPVTPSYPVGASSLLAPNMLGCLVLHLLRDFMRQVRQTPV